MRMQAFLKISISNLKEKVSLLYYFKNPTPIWSGCIQILHESTVKDLVMKDGVATPANYRFRPNQHVLYLVHIAVSS